MKMSRGEPSENPSGGQSSIQIHGNNNQSYQEPQDGKSYIPLIEQ